MPYAAGRPRRDVRPAARAAAALALVAFAAARAGADAVDSRAPRALKRVLLLNQYSSELPVNQITSRAIRGVIGAETDLDVQLFDEYIDQNRLGYQVTQVLTALATKYQGTPFDLMIANGTPVVVALLEHPEIFSGVPKVIVTVDKTVVPKTGLPIGMTGVVSLIGYAGTLDAALRLLPDTRRVLLLSGHAFSDRYNAEAREQWATASGHLAIDFVANGTVEEAVRRVSDLPDQSIVVYDNINRDERGRTYVAADVAAIVSAASRVPVFCLHETLMGRGCVAGHVVSFFDAARRAAEMGMAILHGRPIESIKPEMMGYIDQADWRQLQRWHLNPAKLPAGTTILGREPTLWDRNRSAILAAVGLIAVQAVLIGTLGVQVKRRRQSEAAVRQLSGRMIQAQEEERRRIARELHDSVNQRLSLLMADLQQLGRMQTGRDMSRQVTTLSAEAQGIAEEVRELSHELHSSALTHLGLPAALRDLGRDLARRHGVRVDVTVSDRVPTIDYRHGLCLFRVAQEALNNVVRHAAAATARIDLDYRDGMLHLSVQDDGRGFDPSSAGRSASLGLLGMRERVEQLRGALVASSRPGNGARIEASLPFTPKEAGAIAHVG